MQNKTVIITGASEGIGAATAERFYEKGANIVLIARREKELMNFSNTFKDQSRVRYYAMDVLNYEKFKLVLEETKTNFGKIDVLINNAGANYRGPLLNVSPQEIEAVIAVNLTAPIILIRLILPYLEEQNSGTIINIASLAGRTPVDNAAIYSASKFGIRTFTQSMVYEYANSNKNIKFGLVSPGPIYTNFVLQNIDVVADLVFSQKFSTAYEVADMIISCSEDKVFEYVSGGFFTRTLTNIGYLFPSIKRILTPLMVAKGKRNREYIRKNMHKLPIR
ncbi:MAG: SDR family NAD(P)-dependent oxidoreductase [Solirubrobacteraceae bacterium]